jgi:uncharacterized membrane protein HdeD (DUF308 family)
MEKTMTESMCPMAEICKGRMEKPFSGFIIVVPGILLLALGVVVLIEPRVLVWLAATILIVTGIAALTFARFLQSATH